MDEQPSLPPCIVCRRPAAGIDPERGPVCGDHAATAWEREQRARMRFIDTVAGTRFILGRRAE